MADREVEIGFRTTGADKAAEDAREVADGVKEVSDSAESSAAELKRQSEASEEAAKSLKMIETAAKAVIAARLIENLREGINQLEAFAEEGAAAGAAGDELQKAFAAMKPAITTAGVAMDGLSSGFQAAAATGNPLIGVLAGVVAMAGNVIPAFQAMRAAQKGAENAARDHARALEFAQAAQARLKAEIADEKYIEFLDKETEAVRRNIEELERAARVRKDLEAAAAALGQLGVQTPGADIDTTLQSQLEDLRTRLGIAEQQTRESEIKADATGRLRASALERNGRGSQEFFDADKADQAARGEFERAQRNEAEIRRRNQLAEARARAGAAGQFGGLAGEAGQSITDLANQALQAARSGTQSTAAQDLAAQLEGLLTDQVADTQQLFRIEGLIGSLRQLQGPQFQSIANSLGTIVSTLQVQGQTFIQYENRLRTLEEQAQQNFARGGN